MSEQGEKDERARPGRWRPVLACCAVLAAMAAIVCWPLVVPVGPRSHWLVQAAASRMFIACAAVLVVCGVLLAAVARMLWRLARPYRTARRGEQGVAIIEFALAIPFLLIMGLLMAQASLLMVGNVCVHYAAFCATRTAIVAIPLDNGVAEPRNMILDSQDPTSKKYRVKLSATTALLPVSCGSEDVISAGEGGDVYVNGVRRFLSIEGVEQPGWVDQRLSRKMAYAAGHTDVTVAPPEPRDDDKNGFFRENEGVHVTVRHTFYLSVPTAARIFALFPGGVELGFGQNEYGTDIFASYTLPNEGVQDYVDKETFPQDAN
jgi:hypothetical protein